MKVFLKLWKFVHTNINESTAVTEIKNIISIKDPAFGSVKVPTVIKNIISIQDPALGSVKVKKTRLHLGQALSKQTYMYNILPNFYKIKTWIIFIKNLTTKIGYNLFDFKIIYLK